MGTADERPRENGVDVPADGTGGAETPEQIQAEIARTRQELGQTVELLSAKLDVKTRTKERLGSAKEEAKRRFDGARTTATTLTVRAKDSATDSQGRLRPAVPVGVAVLAVALVTMLAWRYRRR